MARSAYTNSSKIPKVGDKVKICKDGEYFKVWARFIVKEVLDNTCLGYVLNIRCYYSIAHSFVESGCYLRNSNYLTLEDCDNFQLCMFQFD